MSPVSSEYLGAYRLLNLVRYGKTCQLWEAVRDGAPQRYALKVLTSEHRRNKEEVAMLRREYAALSQLDHPRVIKCFELKEDRETVALVLEYFPAPNLKQLIVQGVAALAPRAVPFILQASEALAYVHTRGWIHRDVKPDNFLVDAQGEVKLIDFALAQKIPRGLAKLLSGKGKIQGTRSYMSPEQIRGQVLDPRADLYSFGCVLYELLSGRPPYTGQNTNELLNKHLKAAPPPVQAANPNITPEFAQLLRRMIAKRPEDRPGSLDEFLREFRALRGQVFKNPPRE